MLEQRLLDSHLAGCDACRGFEAGMRSTTELVRSAVLELPERSSEQPVERERRFPLVRGRTALVAAASLVLGALVGSLLERPAEPVPRASTSQVSFLSRDFDQLRDLPRVIRNATPAPIPSGPPNPPEGVI